MGYALPQYLSFCASGDELVFLDLRRDRYFSLAPPLLKDFNTLRTDGQLDRSSARALVTAGVVRETAEASAIIRPTQGPPARRSILEDGATEGARPFAATAAAALAVWATRRMLRTQPFACVISDLQDRKARRSPKPRTRGYTDAEAAARAFLAARTAIPIPSVCLLDSLALCRHLTKLGYEADLILGVCPSPFRAHAWVQQDDVVLNETLDVARMHAPILVI